MDLQDCEFMEIDTGTESHAITETAATQKLHCDTINGDPFLSNSAVPVLGDDDFATLLDWIGNAQSGNASLPENQQICNDGSVNGVHHSDAESMEVMEELLRDDTEQQGSVTNPTDAVLVTPLASPNEANSSGLMFEEELLVPPSPTQSSELPRDSGREAEIENMARYIKDVIEIASTRLDGKSSKLKVHEVILVLLLNDEHGDKPRNLSRILAFCDENGREVSGESEHFKTLDTETMGLLWQKIKGNRTGSYDTFCRAMRIRRENFKNGKSGKNGNDKSGKNDNDENGKNGNDKSGKNGNDKSGKNDNDENGKNGENVSSKEAKNGYFDYLEGGLRCRKRVYRFGAKAMDDMDRMKQTLEWHATTGTYQH